VCCICEAAAASSAEGSSALLAKAVLMLAGNVLRKMALKRTSAGKPSELLTAMDKLKPKDPNSFYAYHFLQRMPREMCILLAHDDLQDMRALPMRPRSRCPAALLQ
jgi:hypothetical protein